MTKHTPISTVNTHEPHLLSAKLLKDLSVTGDLIAETLKKMDEYAGGVPYAVITDSSEAGFPSVARDAFAAAKELHPYPLFKAHALVVTQGGIRLIVNFFLRTIKIVVPHKMFTCPKEASHWARTELLRASPQYIFRILITVSGKVQDVYYRKYCQAQGQQLGIHGFVKNLPDGNVFIDAQGNGSQLLELLEWCKEGSPKAKVNEVTFHFIEKTNAAATFTVA